jgi:flagellar basal-body rod protein FlgF
MDRLIYTAMTGAKALLQRQESLSHNLANANTQGFRAEVMAFRAVPVRAEGTATTRVANLEATAGFDDSPGPMQTTGRALDVAIRGQGYFAVQALDGTEAYTRNGSFTQGPDGSLMNHNGLPVIGEGGPLTAPANGQLLIGHDGTVSAKVGNQPPQLVGRLKLVNPPANELAKGEDGLLRTLTRDPAPSDPQVRVADGVIEGSNVNVVEAMIGMIAVSRQFEMQMKMMQNAETNEQRAQQLLSLRM